MESEWNGATICFLARRVLQNGGAFCGKGGGTKRFLRGVIPMLGGSLSQVGIESSWSEFERTMKRFFQFA